MIEIGELQEKSLSSTQIFFCLEESYLNLRNLSLVQINRIFIAIDFSRSYQIIRNLR